ncbi:hypothetical protein D9758_009592 [Tetrapyrgos nigripes]|uniref:Transposase n=1 Tax=Tetrapyrgos nigripes TaxID=182062 RepID=A0A8H5LMI6_9AGAR|nr:hypothetical protein D9758_009592 [Tetrapyrgos nigripes]
MPKLQVHGTNINLKNCWLSGLLRVINLLKKLNSPNSNIFWYIHITCPHNWTFPAVRLSRELDSHVSISLDAWTSPNGYAFVAIVVHYVMNNRKLEEILIDFKELIGEHSGNNMSEAVWDTLSSYGIQDKIMAFVMDNASNNNTMVNAFEQKCNKHGIIFSAQYS